MNFLATEQSFAFCASLKPFFVRTESERNDQCPRLIQNNDSTFAAEMWIVIGLNWPFRAYYLTSGYTSMMDILAAK